MLLISFRDGGSPPIKVCCRLIFLEYRRDINPSIFSIWPSTCRQGFAYVTFSSKEEAVKALLELNGKLVDGRVVIRDTTKVVKQNRPFHIKDLNKILARSVAVFLGFGSIGMG
ncbi:Uncharacterized protein Rs2_44703 [Raphanus sativus]|nr:Uncharacterized protein Rs2_52271 [Raphanus sativus]KAJ4873609.1 Uncharacterized protein Rs2_44703 [Raphanus sativus]